MKQPKREISELQKENVECTIYYLIARELKNTVYLLMVSVVF